MKLDKIKFARLVAHCVSNGMSAGEYEVNTLDDIIDINIPEPILGRANAIDTDRLMELMLQGTHKIEAIKQYRMMTGMGLKESKDAVERYWRDSPSGAPADHTLGDILAKATK